ncbi:MAG: RpiR family carbohydrate utilization transcriptional regulator [Paracoccaceae bacterium]|jgi:RpiR family carbohydrate utilization transcriptional regulator
MSQTRPAQDLDDSSPKRMPDIVAIIKDSYANLRPAEQSVADAILSDIPSALEASNGEIAIKAGVSQPTVTRFCRSVGCNGVREFRLQLAQSLAVGELFLASDKGEWTATPGDELPPFWGSIFGEARMALREVERQLDADLVLKAAGSIAPARQVMAVGFGGSSSFLAEEVQNRLFRYGVSIMACRDPYVANMTVSTFRPGDVVIAISATGRTPEIVECIELARNYGVCTIAVTAPDSALATAAEIALTTRIAEYPDALTPSATRFAYLTIIDLVAAATGYQMGPQARENLRRIKFNLMEKGAPGSLGPLGD